MVNAIATQHLEERESQRTLYSGEEGTARRVCNNVDVIPVALTVVVREVCTGQILIRNPKNPFQPFKIFYIMIYLMIGCMRRVASDVN